MSTLQHIAFAGIQKLTLLDYPDKTACTLFTAGCNFACPFCHNPALIAFTGKDSPHILDSGYIFEFLSKRQGLLDAVCISGGEPLAQSGIIGFAEKVKSMGFLVKIDTNGSYPGTLKELVKAGLIDYVAMDVKNSIPKYVQTAGTAGFDTAPVEESIEFLLTGAVPYEFRTTVVKELHEYSDLTDIAHTISGAAKYYLQSFDNSENALQPGLSSYSDGEMLEILALVKEVVPCTKLRGMN